MAGKKKSRAVAAPAVKAPVIVPPPRPLSVRLAAFLREAERAGAGAHAEAINAVIVALSDAKQKAQAGRRLVAGAGLTSLMDEIGAL